MEILEDRDYLCSIKPINNININVRKDIEGTKNLKSLETLALSDSEVYLLSLFHVEVPY
jgi:hypothetical protein